VAKVYLDEDVQSDALIQALRSRRVLVLTTSEAGRSKRTDEEQLQFATAEGRVLITSNIADFARLHGKWLNSGLSHSGILLVRQQKWRTGVLARKIIEALNRFSATGPRNGFEFVGGSGDDLNS
jgi:predicted nuclease of predicted toxin-antitoxin system